MQKRASVVPGPRKSDVNYYRCMCVFGAVALVKEEVVRDEDK